MRARPSLEAEWMSQFDTIEKITESRFRSPLRSLGFFDSYVANKPNQYHNNTSWKRESPAILADETEHIYLGVSPCRT